ncbi:molecular chaperone [Salmonella enterica subsp. enterica serovar Oranienburg]|nr:molecular chaperone [Salmonella enterica subsp. enterica serovar Oranienburg]ECA1475460.1 molecular chaperone [Salmonella enterica subsp. enterica serovar Oranienburg]ECA9001407.1 molecular chaperone [Salmonella enterica subsp. enterica serovar Oranienburg]ECA9348233.1 molecular chaperone [Salmonella enterica subsp. enterica serovar Oranienburg]ECD3081590.1 molecular chaperone [Salmonella enterica subsp. enterica serovar Oranienburg]
MISNICFIFFVKDYRGDFVGKLRVVSGILILVVSSMAGADESGVSLGATRVIYPTNSRGVTLSVKNSADNPFLIKSVVLDESTKKAAPFIVTPPLFRLDGGQRNAIKITRTGGDYPADRESLNWLCVQSIPPEPDAVWDEGKKEGGGAKASVSVQLSLNSCIKLLVRPDAVHGNPVDVADKVSWTIKGKDITASNPTPFYMNVSKTTVNGKKLNMERSYIPPFSEEKYSLPESVMEKAMVQWVVVGDYGEKKEKTVIVN